MNFKGDLTTNKLNITETDYMDKIIYYYNEEKDISVIYDDSAGMGSVIKGKFTEVSYDNYLDKSYLDLDVTSKEDISQCDMTIWGLLLDTLGLIDI